MTTPARPADVAALRLREALENSDSSARLQAALAAGTHPVDEYATVLVARCAIEPDFYVRDMLTWSLVRHPASITVPLLLHELEVGVPQARSQALHSLSKIGDPRGFEAITDALLTDPDDEIARSAWRAAVILAPEHAGPRLATILATQLGRGGRDVQLSLSRALAGLGPAADDALEHAALLGSDRVRVHAVATQRLIDDPNEGFETSIYEAKRTIALRDAPSPDEV